MESDPGVHVEMRLRPDDRTVSGEVRIGDGDYVGFVGWLGLLAAIQEGVEPEDGAVSHT